MIFCCMNHQKRNLTLESIGVSPVNIHGLAQHRHSSNAEDELKNVSNVYRENISSAYNVSDKEMKDHLHYMTEIPRIKLRSLIDCMLL